MNRVSVGLSWNIMSPSLHSLLPNVGEPPASWAGLLVEHGHGNEDAFVPNQRSTLRCGQCTLAFYTMCALETMIIARRRGFAHTRNNN